MARRKYDLKGTNDFLVAAVLLLGLGLWAMKDGWFPSEAVVRRHPRELHAVSPIAGTVQEVRALPGQTVLSNQVVATVQPIDASASRGGTVDIRSPAAGTVLAVHRERLQKVEAGDRVLTVAPDDIFYAFNKSLAILSLIASAVCLVIHRAVR